MNGNIQRWIRRLGIGLVLVLGFGVGCFLQQTMLQKTQVTDVETKREVPIYFVETEEPIMALSFDATWGCEHTEAILEVLQKHQVRATFFLTNLWLDAYPDMAKKIAASGHEIAMHSVSHPHMNSLSAEEISTELEENRKCIEQVTGFTPELFRFPYGEYDNQGIQTVRQKGLYPIQWSIDSLDWEPSKTVEAIVDRVTMGLHPGAIILCHNNGMHTAEAVDQIITYALEQGYRFVPIGELIYKGEYQVNAQGMQEKPKTKATVA